MTKGELEATAILAGGDPFSPTMAVTPGVLSSVDEFTRDAVDDTRTVIPENIEGRRKALADWVASPRNPLTSRVMVNRIWQWHFGQAIAASANNFGATGKKPTHPELLDYLAAEFVEQGWSIKALHLQIMTSAAYRRSAAHPHRVLLSEKDPEGTSHAAFRPRRLTAEELRDTLLAVSGELNPAVGGIPVRPEINLEAALQPRQVMGTFAPAWQPSPQPAQRHRRSLYALKLRGLRDPAMEVFNEPNLDLSCERRDASTVTPQVFSLFNSQASYSRAVAFAVRLKHEAKDRPQVITRAFVLTFGRAPKADELHACLDHWDEMTDRHRNLTFKQPRPPTEIVREAAEENTGENFAFVEELEMNKDFVSDLTLAEIDADTRGLVEVCLVLMNCNEFVYVD